MESGAGGVIASTSIPGFILPSAVKIESSLALDGSGSSRPAGGGNFGRSPYSSLAGLLTNWPSLALSAASSSSTGFSDF